MMFRFRKDRASVSAGLSVGIVELRFLAEDLLRLSVCLGQRLFEFAIGWGLPAIDFAVEDLLCIHPGALVTVRAGAFRGNWDWLPVLSRRFLLNDVDRT